MKHNSTFLFISVVVLSVLVYTCIGETCRRNITCERLGCIVDNVTGEAGFCTVRESAPICAGVDENGNNLTTTTPNPEETTTITPSPTTTTTTPSCEVEFASCDNKVVGVYAYPECKCEKYYTCKKPASGSDNLVLRKYTCTGGKVFNNNTYSCVTNKLVCPYALA
ncbi:hypothetical protein OTU49_003787 [Cherax quadricarinatus]|uniref:Chitin-binding type-2 domain-containing protein n=1 Tax=Cherax quadricarinatus TaxID=27406 RepID=A0AAW0XH63_CHEQU